MYLDSYWASFKIIPLGPTRSMETFSQKNSIFPMKNTLVIFFAKYRVWQRLSNILLGFTRYYGNRCARYKILSVTPKRLLKTQIFGKKTLSSRRKRYFGPFFVLSSRTDVREQFSGVLNVF